MYVCEYIKISIKLSLPIITDKKLYEICQDKMSDIDNINMHRHHMQ